MEYLICPGSKRVYKDLREEEKNTKNIEWVRIRKLESIEKGEKRFEMWWYRENKDISKKGGKIKCSINEQLKNGDREKVIKVK